MTAGRLKAVAPSKTTAFTTLVAAERRKGRRIIDLAVGEYTGAAPAGVIAATRQALAAGQYRYGPVAGMPPLRERLARRAPGRTADNVIVTNGAKQALFHLFQAICDPGAEVIIPTPCWVSFPQMVRLAGGHPMMVPCDGRHQLDLDRILAAVSPNTCAVLVNSPNNPTGAVYPEAALARLVDAARSGGFVLISDETYADLVYDGSRHCSVAAISAPEAPVVQVGSFSKSFAMTGFRVGYAMGPTAVINDMTVIQSHGCGNVCTFAQHGALAAMDVPPDDLAAFRETLAARRRAALARIGGVMPCTPPQGAFYLFPDISDRLNNGATAETFCVDLLTQAGVAVVPGEAFDAPDHIRISFAVDAESLEEGIARIIDFL